MGSLLLAISFLTIIPAYGNRVAGEKELANSLYFYPVVGFVIGGILALLAYLSNLLSLGIAGDALIIVIWVILTGGLHLDGFMDTADGIFSGKEREKKLEIMKDSRVGAMGVIALGVQLLLKFAFIASLNPMDKIWVVFLAPAVGRCLMVYSILFFPYARKGPGLGICFGENVGKIKVLGATVLLLIGSVFASGLIGILFTVISYVLAILIANWLGSILGGQTGDTYGALCEATETVFLLTVVIGMAGYYGL